MTTPISTDLDALCVVYIPAASVVCVHVVSIVCVQSALCYVYILYM